MVKKKATTEQRVQGCYWMLGGVLGIIIVFIVISEIRLAVVEGSYWRDKGERFFQRDIPVPAQRGNIYADGGELMATSEKIYRLSIDLWAQNNEKYKTADTIVKYRSHIFSEIHRILPAQSAAQLCEGFDAALAYYKKNIGKPARECNRDFSLSKQVKLNFLQLQELKRIQCGRTKKKNKPVMFFNSRHLSGLKFEEMNVRINPYGTLASRTIGDVYGIESAERKSGKNGLELGYDSLLSGKPGTAVRQSVEKEYIDRIVQRPIAGRDIVSTININLQDITERALTDKLRELDAESGTAVLMETATGEIKAITNMGRIREGVWGETKNYAISDISEPGSTFKVASMMVALEDGVVKPNDPVDVGNGLFHYSTHTIKDHNAHRGGYGQITAEQAIWYSSNVGVAKIILKGYEKNPAKYVEGLYRLGFNRDLDLEIPGYGKAIVKHPDSTKLWSRLSLPQMAYGYETQIPPIYTLTFFNAIANGGRMVKPRFVSEIKDGDDIVERKETIVLNKQICSPQTLGYIRSMLDSVVNYPAVPNPNVHSGTGKPARSEIVRIAGKTGTAQLWSASGRDGYQVSFCGYFPSDAPKYSCIVVIRRPRNGNASGGYMCGAVFKRIAEEITGLGDFSRQPVAAAADDSKPHTPRVKSGLYDRVKYATKKLDVAYSDSLKGNWTTAVNRDEQVVFCDRYIGEKTVPNVVGMGARDAVFALEQAGLRVVMNGRGAVHSQSLTAGTKISHGQTVAIHLQ
jgi:cell division protein FtsI (penicillin-binding protein 3)